MNKEEKKIKVLKNLDKILELSEDNKNLMKELSEECSEEEGIELFAKIMIKMSKITQ